MRAMWLTLRKKFIGELTLAGLTLTALAGAAFQWFLPAKACHYWLCIPVFFYFVGLMYIGMVSFFCRWGADTLLGGLQAVGGLPVVQGVEVCAESAAGPGLCVCRESGGGGVPVHLPALLLRLFSVRDPLFSRG